MGSPTHDAADTSVNEEHGTDTAEQASETPVEVNTQGGDAVVNTAPDGGGVDQAAPVEDTSSDTSSDSSDSSDNASE